MTGWPFFDLSRMGAAITGTVAGEGRCFVAGLAEVGANIAIGSKRFDQCTVACHEITKKTVAQPLPLSWDVKDRNGARAIMQLSEHGKPIRE